MTSADLQSQRISTILRRQWKLQFISLLFIILGVFPQSIHAQEKLPTQSIMPSTPSVAEPEPTSSPPSIFVVDPSTASAVPSDSTVPSSSPSILSMDPTTSNYPTIAPSISAKPSEMPSIRPTLAPSLSEPPSNFPSSTPTNPPTFSDPVTTQETFTQTFIIDNGREFSEKEIRIIEERYISYTSQFSSIPHIHEKVDTNCTVILQKGGPPMPTIQPTTSEPTTQPTTSEPTSQPTTSNSTLSPNLRGKRRELQAGEYEYVDLDYVMNYTSVYINVSDYPALFQAYINTNNETVALQLQIFGLNVTHVMPAYRYVLPPMPTSGPTVMPSPAPSISHGPSFIPSTMPSDMSADPTVEASVTPSAFPTTPIPSLAPEIPPATQTIVIIVSTVIGGSIIFVGVLIYCRKRDLNGADPGTKDRSKITPSSDEAELEQLDPLPFRTPPPPDSTDQVASPGGSLISEFNSIGGKSEEEEVDTTHILEKEFNQIVNNSFGDVNFDSVMVNALTGPLIDFDDDFGQDLQLGNNAKWTGTEIEANTLLEVTDWKRQKVSASFEEKSTFMQETLNKMVASVLHGIVGPDDASRTIHECAALLGLHLEASSMEDSLAHTTLIVTGMSHTVSQKDLIDAFEEFGQINDAALAPNKREFGILRFKNNQSVRMAMEKVQLGKVLVQDEQVQVEALYKETSY